MKRINYGTLEVGLELWIRGRVSDRNVAHYSANLSLHCWTAFILENIIEIIVWFMHALQNVHSYRFASGIIDSITIEWF